MIEYTIEGPRGLDGKFPTVNVKGPVLPRKDEKVVFVRGSIVIEGSVQSVTHGYAGKTREMFALVRVR